MFEDNLLQSLRRDSTGRVYQVQARLHPSVQEYVVLWDEILQAFPSAISVLNGAVVVPWVRDAAFHLIEPKCINYQSGRVLEVMKNGDSSPQQFVNHLPTSENMVCVSPPGNTQWTMQSTATTSQPPTHHHPSAGSMWRISTVSSPDGAYISPKITLNSPKVHFRPLDVPTETDASEIAYYGNLEVNTQLDASPGVNGVGDIRPPELLKITFCNPHLIFPSTKSLGHSSSSSHQTTTSDKIIELSSTYVPLSSSNGDEVTQPLSQQRPSSQYYSQKPDRPNSFQQLTKHAHDQPYMGGSTQQPLGPAATLPITHMHRIALLETTANCPPEDFSRMRTMVFNSSLTYPRVKEIYTAICSCGNSALKKMVWDITDLGNFRILQTVLAILHSAKRLNRSKKPKVTIMIRLYEGQGEMGGLGSEGGEGRGIYNAIWPDLYNLLNSEMSSYICILFTKFVTRLELFGRDLYTFSSRFPQSYIWTMNELRELLVDGQSTQLNGRSLQCLLDIVSRSPDITRPRTRTLKPAQPLQQLIIQNIRLFDIQWSQLLTSIDWLTIRRVSFRGSDFKNGNLVKLETEVIRLVMQCRDKQRVLSKNGLSDEDAAMVQGLKARQGGDAPLLVSLYHTDVTIDQILETRERLHKQGIRWCIFPMNDI